MEALIFQTLFWVQLVSVTLLLTAQGFCSSLLSLPREALASVSHVQLLPFPSTLAPPVEKPAELTSGKDKKSLWGDRISTFEILPVTLWLGGRGTRKTGPQ